MTSRRRFLLQSAVLPSLAFATGRATTGVRCCIRLHLTGGPSQLDTFDPKPDAPSTIRGPFRPIRTNVPGIWISELFPRMARMADQYAIIRSMHAPDVEPVHPEPPASTVSFAGVLDNAESARIVDVNMFTSVEGATWDAHGWQPYATLRDYADTVAPAFDAAFTTLLEGLRQRGLLNTTLVIASGEFGRTPKLNPAGGRDHWPECWSMLVAGGGVRGGQVIGESDRWAAEPKHRPVTPAEIDATIRYALDGVITPAAQPVRELFA